MWRSLSLLRIYLLWLSIIFSCSSENIIIGLCSLLRVLKLRESRYRGFVGGSVPLAHCPLAMRSRRRSLHRQSASRRLQSVSYHCHHLRCQ